MRLFMKTALGVLTTILVSSCSSNFIYGPGNLGSGTRFLLKPANKDSIHHSHNLSVSYSFNQGDGYNFDERNRYADVFYHLGYSRKYFSCAAGTGLFGGSYEVNKFTQSRGWKRYYGITGIGEAALNIPIGNLNWRILGIRGSVTSEGGDFYDFRIKNKSYPGFINYTSERTTGTVGTFSELDLKLGNYRLGFGQSNSLVLAQERILGFCVGISGHFTYKRTTAIYQLLGSTWQGNSMNVGLSYRL